MAAAAAALTQAEVVGQLARQLGGGRARAARLLRACLQLVAEHLAAGGDVRLRGLGTLAVVRRAPRVLRHPADGRLVRVAARPAVAFRPSRRLQQAAGRNARATAARG